MAKDPICGMTVDEKTAKYKSDYNDQTYYFCAASCKTAFDKNPARYLKANPGTSKHSGCGCGGH
jgi:YHS domain-containing protein